MTDLFVVNGFEWNFSLLFFFDWILFFFKCSGFSHLARYDMKPGRRMKMSRRFLSTHKQITCWNGWTLQNKINPQFFIFRFVEYNKIVCFVSKSQAHSNHIVAIIKLD